MHRIRTRLMIAILVAAVLPAVPMSLVVGNLLERSLNPALHAELIAGLEAGMDVSREDLARRKAEFTVVAERALRGRPARGQGGDWPPLVVLDERGHPAQLPVPDLENPGTLDETARLMAGHLAVKLESAQGTPVIVAQKLPDEAVARAGEISGALSLLAAFRFERESILRSYVWPFLLVYAALILAALAVAATVSNRLARPLEEIARAASKVADGDLETRVNSRARGEVGDLVGAFNDMVTRLGQQRQELARLEKLSAWRGMARMLAHEIKNPLTPILLAVQEAKNSYRGEDEDHATVLAECEAIVTEEVDGLRGLVRSFSDFARPPKPDCKTEEVSELLDGLDRLYGDRLEVRHDPQIGSWNLDAAQMKRALINLIDNGLTACERAGTEPLVKVVAIEAGGRLQINVTDQGSGISSEDLRHIFEPDFTTSSQGMGLGLPIVAGIVEGHGGTIKISTGDEAGTQFSIALPRITPKKEEI